MSHFSKQAIESDPDGLTRLHEILHGRSTAARTGKTASRTPTLEERFGRRPDQPGKPVRACRLVPAR